MQRTGPRRGGWLGAALALVMALAGCERGPVDTSQGGFRGTGMAQLENRRLVEADAALHAAPEIARPARVRENAPLAGATYKNVQVLGEQTIGEFGRTMNAITAWVSPKQSCAYCHVEGDFASDAKYTKVVARRMLQMVRHVNTDWQPHVGNTGVTCYTCHRGNPLPSMVWFRPPADAHPNNLLLNRSTQNAPAKQVGLTSLPADPFSEFLWKVPPAERLRVIGPTALPTGPAAGHASLARTESTYGLMVHVSKSLGVNCTFCHNSRSFAAWPQSPPQRSTAWYGIRMVRDLNANYLDPLTPVFPPVPVGRLGPSGDAAKLHCATCHQGVHKPLNGAQTARYYAALWPRPDANAAAAAAPASAASAPSATPPDLPASGVELLAKAAAASAPAAAPAPTAPSAPATVVAAAPVAAPAAPTTQSAKVAAAEAPPGLAPAAPVPPDAACVALAAQAAQRAPKVAESAVNRQVVGAGRLHFHAAPRDDCRIRGVFILAGEAGEVEREAGGWSLLWYRNPRTGGEASGWVQTPRLSPISPVMAKALSDAGAKATPSEAAAQVAAAATRPASSPKAAESSAAMATVGADPDCIQLALGAMQQGKAVPPASSERRVAGSGPLQFHWAPEASCRMDGVFIVPGDPVEADRVVGDFTAVWYRNPRTGAEATGWVRSARLVPGAAGVSAAR